jgi:hypothetical protein
METYRAVYRNIHGRVRANFNTEAIKETSVVLITAAQREALGDWPPHRIVGDTNVWVSNIAPHGPPKDPNNGVTFILNVDSGEPLNVVADITVLDSPVVFEGEF